MNPLVLLALPAAFAGKSPGQISVDTDGDGVYDYEDVCQGEDDTVDLDSNGVQDCVETFISDSGFAQSANGSAWALNGVGLVGWQAPDANGFAGSGSYQVFKQDWHAVVRASSECMAVSPTTPHVLASHVRHTPNSGPTSGYLEVYSYDSLADCQGAGSTVRLTERQTIGNTLNIWRTWGAHFTTDSQAHAVRIDIATSGVGTTRLDIDNVLLHDTLGDSDEEVIEGMD